MKSKVKSKHVVLSLVFLVLGFIVSFSYQITKSETENREITSSQWERDAELRSQLVDIEQRNLELQKSLFSKQAQITEIEKRLSLEEEQYSQLAQEAEKYRMFLGKVPVKGTGVSVTLSDGMYNPLDTNVNNYIVHEQHVFKVINELYISGANAISINGKRITSQSYIVCNGPVIEVDGKQFPAPFVISAIGQADTMIAALNIVGGVKDQLVNDNLIISIEKQNEITMEPILSNS